MILALVCFIFSTKVFVRVAIPLILCKKLRAVLSAVRIEDAGFEIRDMIAWVYASGFPKSHNIGQAIDKLKGNDREVVGENPNHRKKSGLLELGFQDGKESSTITK